MKSNLARFSIAFVLAVAAAILNVIWVWQKTPATEQYVVFTTDIDRGTIIDVNEHIAKIEIPVLEKKLSDVFVPYENRNSLSGWVATRSFQKGEMIRHVDFKPIDSLPEYEVLGPFRLISVGSRFSQELAREDDDTDSGQDQKAVTIAVKRDFNEATRRLLQIIETQRGKDNVGALRIIAVTTFLQPEAATPSTLTAGARPALFSQRPADVVANRAGTAAANPRKLAADEIALFVPLPDVPAISQVLLAEANPHIGFVVPAEVVHSDVVPPIRSVKVDDE